jgi:hypothetical protein
VKYVVEFLYKDGTKNHYLRSTQQLVDMLIESRWEESEIQSYIVYEIVLVKEHAKGTFETQEEEIEIEL